MGFMDDEDIAAALSQRCVMCPAQPGEEYIDIVTGKPLLEVSGRPIHIARREP